ncbi:tetranectin [Polyodon spathula]|uniref:tetranectin n=1 Tax=Polyodon spathula TaxID=7913 RepID=UPI001B7DCDEB|nr:tetranectin [Polyodon spathula]
MELRGTCLLLCFLCLVHSTLQQPPPKTKLGGKKDAVNAAMIDDLKKQIENIWQELNLLKEQQALQTVCLKGTKIHGKCYLAVNEQKKYHAASDECISLGGTLSTPANGDENDSLFDYMRKSIGVNSQIWLGINDMASEGSWIDMTGSSIKYKNWETEITAQPDGERSQNCVVLSSTANGKWFDENCRAEKAFICEFNIV